MPGITQNSTQHVEEGGNDRPILVTESWDEAKSSRACLGVPISRKKNTLSLIRVEPVSL